ncbi:MAG: NAD-dependent epimerase/dehydratase family protein, partial [Elusimicrobiales bacterium]
IQSLIRGVPGMDLTPGGQRRDFVYIDDTVEALSAIISHEMRSAKKYVSYEVGSGQPVSIREFVETIKRLTGNDSTRLNFGALPYRENEVMESKADLALVKSLGWLPKVPLAEGLERTIALEKRRTRQ